MTALETIRVAWLFPSLRKGSYWHPIFRDFSRRFQTIIYTGLWSGFAPGLEETFTVEVVGKTQFGDYSSRFTYASPAIAQPLLKFRPQVVFASGFSIWTILALLLKPIGGWRVLILYDGSSPSIDFRNSRLRLPLRRWTVSVADGCCANSRAATDYLVEVLHASREKVFSHLYLVPDVAALLSASPPPPQISDLPILSVSPSIPTFLFVGELIPRKGLRQLLQACVLLQQQNQQNYRLLIVGDGEERSHLEDFVQQHGLSDQVIWKGWVPYGQLGACFQAADSLIFPTLEDVWGMVLLEAMAFGKPVLCSKWAGAAELIVPGENGDLFDPHQPEQLATLMQTWLRSPDLLHDMGEKARQAIAPHTPAAAVENFVTAVHTVLDHRDALVT